ncbi:TPA: hypothetical protein I7286_18980 [Vibrio parahaemolyticus]|uniref:hypothetical protein n=1 Tax=uncultured Vibrio sp. TaxID=114054 RepID=UPI001A2BE716|nr:hypothetical protein [uncultured Vibrio sp.]HAS6902115.1 hypothetical protein [Vibrio parahaemolyticus]
MFTEKEINNTIKLLENNGSFTVKKLADHLGVSRTYLYDNFGDLLPDRSADTEKKIVDAIRKLKAITSRKKLKITEVADVAGLTRQCISQSYSHLIPIIKGDEQLPEINDDILILENKVSELQYQIDDLKIKHNKEIYEIKNNVFSQFMKKDIDHMKGQDLRANIIDLQYKNDEYVSVNRDLLKDISQLRTENSNLISKCAKASSGCEIIATIEPDYSSIKPSMDHQLVMELFFKEERKNIDIAIPVCNASKPDEIIFFQSFLCDHSKELHLPTEGRVVIIKSNFPLKSLFEKIVKEINSNTIHAVSIKPENISQIEHGCRNKYKALYNKDFIAKYYDLITYPTLNDGFRSITTIKPEDQLSVVN